MRTFLWTVIIQWLLTSTATAYQSDQQGRPNCDCFPNQSSSPYNLPYEPGSAFPASNTTGHYRSQNGGVGLYAIDFRMPIGTPIVASRDGKVVASRDEFEDGNGINLEENFVFIQHSDSTIARYFHLTNGGARVKIGQRVSQGDVIGISGNTGQSAYPHLHFDVQQCGPNLPPNYNQMPCGQTIPVSFQNTEQHGCGLQVEKVYVALE